MNRLNKLFSKTVKRQNLMRYTLLITLFTVTIWQVSALTKSDPDANTYQTVNSDSLNYLPLILSENATAATPTPNPDPTPTPDPTSVPVSLPEIVSFSTDSHEITVGESAILSWVVSGSVTELILNPSIGDVLGETNYTVSPTETTTYTLVAKNSAGMVEAEITITVNEPEPQDPPTIHFFTASSSTIEVGESVTLSWDVSDFDSLELNQQIGDVTGLTTYEISPTENTTYRLRAVNAHGEVLAQLSIEVEDAGVGDDQIVIYDWNGDVTPGSHGFPMNQPPLHNYDWTTPVNYAQGTLYVRAEVRDIPVAQPEMYLQFCFWQSDVLPNGTTYNFALETCLSTKNVPAVPDTTVVVCWHQSISQMWQKDGVPLEWDRERYRVAVPIKVNKVINNSLNKYPVTDWKVVIGQDAHGDDILLPKWAGEEVTDWFDMDMRFTAIVVKQGGTFSGWGDYGGCGN